jgi:two-component system chemotaxis response regulator CheB
VAAHELIVIGASAGGVEALAALVAGLPPDLPAAVCVVVHMRPFGESHLAEVLTRIGPLPAVAAQHGMPLRPGTIHVAVPDLHLLVERGDGGGTLRLARGPKENRNRPAIDPLFRSAALAYGPQVIGVILSGALDDGTAGLWAVRDRGGISVVQDPDDALVTSMPRSALDEVGADHVATAAEIGPLLGRLVRRPARAPLDLPAPGSPHAADTAPGASATDAGSILVREVAMASVDESVHQQNGRYGVPSRFPCPDCGGVLWDVSATGPLRYRCETGHAYSAAALDEVQMESVEEALWAALRAIEDKIAFARVRAEHAQARGLDAFARRFAVQEEAAQQHGAALRTLLRLGGRGGIGPRDEPEPARS